MAGVSPAFPVFYCYFNLAEAVKRPVFWISVWSRYCENK